MVNSVVCKDYGGLTSLADQMDIHWYVLVLYIGTGKLCWIKRFGGLSGGRLTRIHCTGLQQPLKSCNTLSFVSYYNIEDGYNAILNFMYNFAVHHREIITSSTVW